MLWGGVLDELVVCDMYGDTAGEGLDDLTDTIRGAIRAAVVAGIGVADASSTYTSDAIESRARDGVMEYLVYRLLVYLVSLSVLPDRMEELPEYVLPRRSPIPKKSSSPWLLKGLLGVASRCAAGMGGTGACMLFVFEPLRFVTPGMYAI